MAYDSMMQEPRVRFNGGYHDARADRDAQRTAHWDHSGFTQRDGTRGHYDRMYVRGYRAGQRSDPEATRSTAAWQRRNS